MTGAPNDDRMSCNPSPRRSTAKSSSPTTTAKSKTTEANMRTLDNVEQGRILTGTSAAAALPRNDSSVSTQYLTAEQFFGVHRSPTANNLEIDSTIVSPAPGSDYSLFMAEYGARGSRGSGASTRGRSDRRADGQLHHYFNVDQYHRNAEQQQQQAISIPQTGAQVRKPTKQEIEQFKKRREERKRIKNRWLFE